MDVCLFCCFVSLLLSVTAVSLDSGDDGWSMKVQTEVRGMEGYPAVLPCTFSHPLHSQHSSLQVSWRLGHTVVFSCTSRTGAAVCEPGPQQDQRYRMEGNPRQHDLSLRINSAALQDSGRYYCRVEVAGREHVSFEDKMGTRLRVEAPPHILSVSVQGSQQTGFQALCQVQGSPPPDVQWLGPDDLLQEAQPGALVQDSSHFHTVSQLIDVEPGQQYSCSASNPLGRDRAALYVLHPRPTAQTTTPPVPLLLLLLVALGAKGLLLVGVGGALVRRRR